MRMRYPFSQELFQLTNTGMQTGVTTKYNFFPFSQKSEQSLLYLDVRSIRDNYAMELRDRVTGHGF